MQPLSENADQFFSDELRRLQAQGYQPEEAAEILLQAQRAILDACRQLLEQIKAGKPPAEPERTPDSGAPDARGSPPALP